MIMTPTEFLFKKPYIQVPFGIEQSQINQAKDAFFAFLALPDEIKHHIQHKISPMHRRGELGFIHRDLSDEDIYNDSKDFFHFHPVLIEQYADFLSKNSVVKDFLNLAIPIWQETYDVTRRVLGTFENDYPGTMSKIYDAAEPHIVLRFLKYNWASSGEYLAKPHFDSGSFTLAISESCPGLRIGTGPNDLEVINHEAGKALFMISSNFRKIIDTDKLSPGWHDVIQTDETQIGKAFARWAIVAFIDGHNVTALPKSETHKWYNPLI